MQYAAWRNRAKVNLFWTEGSIWIWYGTGNYYIEAQTRDARRTDVVVDYLGEQFVVEMKIWHGNEYNERGEKQLAEYLDYYHQKKGYMLSFNFNKKRETGMKVITIGDKTIVEAMV